MTRPDCRNDLVMQARRQRLSATDQTRLDEHLLVCSACQFDRRIAADFDEVSSVPPGYEVRDAELADAVLRRASPSSAPRAIRARPLLLRAAVVAALVVAAAGAAASILAHRGAAPALRPVLAVAPAFPVSDDALTTTPAPRTAAEPPLREVTEPPPRRTRARSGIHGRAVPSAFHHARPAAQPAHAVDTDAPPSAASLFEQATRERQHKHAAAAIELYGDLQQRFPASDEAHLSHVSLGRLLLDHGMAPEAVSQFQEYLTGAGDGLLAPEALFGKARALDAMERREEAGATWRQLLTSFPRSVYAAEATRRLEASP